MFFSKSWNPLLRRKLEKQQEKEHANTITRLSLHEFSLYGKKLLNLEQFSEVITQLESIAQNNLDNVHLLLSSFSVLDEYNNILNIAIYLQGGSNAKIDIICKNQAHKAAIPAVLHDLCSKGCLPERFRKPSTARTAVESAMDGFMRVCKRVLVDRPCLL